MFRTSDACDHSHHTDIFLSIDRDKEPMSANKRLEVIGLLERLEDPEASRKYDGTNYESHRRRKVWRH